MPLKENMNNLFTINTNIHSVLWKNTVFLTKRLKNT